MEQTAFHDAFQFTMAAQREFAQELRATDRHGAYRQFEWFASAAVGCGRTEDEIHDLLFEIDQRFNVDEQFIFDLSFGTDRIALFFAGLIAASCRFLSTSLDPTFREEGSIEQTVRQKLEMAIDVSESMAQGRPPPGFGVER